ncbi:MAG: hypothetical protein P1P90_04300 [Patescibacteria group bacterium]|nr:hypothetical protein [Patescibacteria group bacterium]
MEEISYTQIFDISNPPSDPESWWLIMEGDFGGQIYLTVPLKLLGSKANPIQLLAELDKIAWDCNEGDGTYLYLHSPSLCLKAMQTATIEDEDEDFDPEALANWISGGMGGGECQSTIWIHPEFSKLPTRVARIHELLDLTP